MEGASNLSGVWWHGRYAPRRRAGLRGVNCGLYFGPGTARGYDAVEARWPPELVELFLADLPG